MIVAPLKLNMLAEENRNKFNYKRWLKERQITTRVFYFINFLDVIEYTLIYF